MKHLYLSFQSLKYKVIFFSFSLDFQEHLPICLAFLEEETYYSFVTIAFTLYMQYILQLKQYVHRYPYIPRGVFQSTLYLLHYSTAVYCLKHVEIVIVLKEE